MTGHGYFAAYSVQSVLEYLEKALPAYPEGTEFIVTQEKDCWKVEIRQPKGGSLDEN
jgi:hypothetical protein